MEEKSPFDESEVIEARDREQRPVAPRPRPYHQVPPRPIRRRSIFWPIVLIGAGILILLGNLGLFPSTGWAVLWRLWPLALIALGIDVMIGRRSTTGAILSAVIILLLLGLGIGMAVFAENIPFIIDWMRPAEMQYESVAYPQAGIESASIFIDWTSAPGYLSALDDSNNLIEADVAYRGELIFDVDKSGDQADVVLESYLQGVRYSNFTFDDDAVWDIRLSPNVAIDLELDSGSGGGDYDLRDLSLSHLELDSGSGRVELLLPDASSFDGKIDSGSGVVTLVLPDSVGLRVDLDDGSGSFRVDQRFVLVSGDADDDGVWETENYDGADYRINLSIDQGSGAIRIQ